MQNSDMQDTINRLERRVDDVTGTGNSAGSYFPNFSDTSSMMYYAAIPVVVGGALVYLKPGFLMEMDSFDGEYPEHKLNYRRLLLTTMVLSAAIGIGIYMYFFRKKPAAEMV